MNGRTRDCIYNGVRTMKMAVILGIRKELPNQPVCRRSECIVQCILERQEQLIGDTWDLPLTESFGRLSWYTFLAGVGVVLSLLSSFVWARRCLFLTVAARIKSYIL
jgi:hypothetical protein